MNYICIPIDVLPSKLNIGHIVLFPEFFKIFISLFSCHCNKESYYPLLVVGSREFECCMCKMKVSSGSNTGRILTRPTLDASGYDASSANEIDIRVCQKCKAKGMKPKVVTYVLCPTIISDIAFSYGS